MSNGQLTTVYLETNWTRFQFPYYVKEEDTVYHTVHTDVTSLNAKNTWDFVEKEHVGVALEFFKAKGYFTVKVQASSETKLPLSNSDVVKDCGIESSDGSKTMNIAENLFTAFKRSIDPRPDGTVSILYKLGNAAQPASSLVNIKKIQADFAAWASDQPKPAMSQGDERGWSGDPKDFSLKLTKAAGGTSTIKKGLGKVKDIKNLRDVNDFLGAIVKESKQLRMSAMASHAFGGDPGEIDFASDVKDTFSTTAGAMGLPSRSDIVNENLQAAEFISDYALLDVPYMLDDIGVGTGAFGGSETAKAFAEGAKNYKAAMDKYFAIANKWGLNGILECVLAHMIAQMKLSNPMLAALMLQELKELVKTYKSFSTEFQQYKKLYELAMKKFKAGQDWQDDWGAKLKKAAEAALEEAGKQVIKLLTQFCLQALVENQAYDDFDYGFVPPESFFKPDEPIAALEAFAPGKPISPEQEEDMRELMDDLFANLRPQEICSLLQGTNTNLLYYIWQKIKKTYSSLEEMLATQQQVANFLAALGKMAGTGIVCKKVADDAEKKATEIEEYCGIKMPKGLSEAYKKKLNGQPPPDFPSISLDDFNDLFDPDYLANILPPFDYLPMLEPAYKEAQEDLYAYQKIFVEDLTSIIDPPSKDAAAKPSTEDTTAMNKANKDYKGDLGKKGYISPAKALGLKGDEAAAFQVPLEGTILEKFDPIGIHVLNKPVKGYKIVNGKKQTDLTFKLLQSHFLDSAGNITINDNGTFDIDFESDQKTYAQYFKGLPVKGNATKNNKSPLTIVGNTVPLQPGEDIDLQPENPAMRKILKDSQGLKSLNIAGLYTDMVFSVMSGQVDFLSKVTKKIDLIEELKFFRPDRRERIQETLCLADKQASKGVEEPAQKYIENRARAMDIESLRIFTYLLLIETYPNLVVTLMTLPQELVDKYFDIDLDIVSSVVEKFEKIVNDSFVTIPVRNIMCSAGLTVENLIEDEIKFLASTTSSTKLLDVDSVLKNTLAITANNSGNMTLYRNETFIKYFLKKKRDGIIFSDWYWSPSGYCKGNQVVHNGEYTIRLICESQNWCTGGITALGDVRPGIDLIIEFFDWAFGASLAAPDQPQVKYPTYDFFPFYFVETLPILCMMIYIFSSLGDDTADTGIQGILDATFFDAKWEMTVDAVLDYNLKFTDIGGGKVHLDKKLGKAEVTLADPKKLGWEPLLKSWKSPFEESTKVTPKPKMTKKDIYKIEKVKKNAMCKGDPGDCETEDQKVWVGQEWGPPLVKDCDGGWYWHTMDTRTAKALVACDTVRKNMVSSMSKYKNKNDLFSAKSDKLGLESPPLLDAFKPEFIELLIVYYVRPFAFAPKERSVFLQLKPAIMGRFSNSASGIPIGIDIEEALLAEAAFAKIKKPSLKDFANQLGMALWILIFLMIPKLVLSAIKSLILSALYFSNPVIYILLMMAESLGLSLSDFFDWLKKKAQEDVLKSLDPASPQAEEQRKVIAETKANSPDAILDYKCDI
jgi:hypothetical protein